MLYNMFCLYHINNIEFHITTLLGPLRLDDRKRPTSKDRCAPEPPEFTYVYTNMMCVSIYLSISLSLSLSIYVYIYI